MEKSGCSLRSQALEQNLANLKEQSSRLRQNVGAKEAELAVVRAEAEALRRLHAIHTGTDGEAQVTLQELAQVRHQHSGTVACSALL